MLSHIQRMSDLYMGDHELRYVLQITSSMNFYRFYTPEKVMEIVVNGVSFKELSLIVQTPINALSVSQVGRIPRESARRKLKKLLELGYLELSPDGGAPGYITSKKTIEYFFESNRLLYEDFAACANTIELMQKNIYSDEEK